MVWKNVCETIRKMDRVCIVSESLTLIYLWATIFSISFKQFVTHIYLDNVVSFVEWNDGEDNLANILKLEEIIHISLLFW